MVKLTRLQREFLRSYIFRETAYSEAAAIGLPVHGFKSLIRLMYADRWKKRGEPQLKKYLYRLLSDPRQTQDVRQDVLKLLRTSENTLTQQQRKYIKMYLRSRP